MCKAESSNESNQSVWVVAGKDERCGSGTTLIIVQQEVSLDWTRIILTVFIRVRLLILQP